MSTGAIKWLDVGRLLREPPPDVDWVVKWLIARGHLTLLAGAHGVGKSLLGDAIASAVSHGAPTIAGMPVSGGPVVILDAENGEHLRHQRAHLVDLPPDRVAIGIAETVDLRTGEGLDELSAKVAELDPALVFLDGLASLAPGLKENEADHAGPVLNRLRRLAQASSAGWLLLHNTVKYGDHYRGGTAIAAAVDVAATYGRPRDSTDPERRVLDWSHEKGGKMRLGPEPEPVHLRVQVVAGRLTIESADPPTPDESPPPRATARELLRARAVTHVAEHGRAAQADLLRALGRDPKDRTGRRALEEALAAGELHRGDDGTYALTTGGNGATPATPAVATPAAQRGGTPATPATATCHQEEGVGGRQGPVGGPATCHLATPIPDTDQAEFDRLAAKFPELIDGGRP